MEDKYNISLFDTSDKKVVLTYDSPILPHAGDLIKVKGDYFVIKERAFPVYHVGSLIQVDLLGTFESDQVLQEYNSKSNND